MRRKVPGVRKTHLQTAAQMHLLIHRNTRATAHQMMSSTRVFVFLLCPADFQHKACGCTREMLLLSGLGQTGAAATCTLIWQKPGESAAPAPGKTVPARQLSSGPLPALQPYVLPVQSPKIQSFAAKSQSSEHRKPKVCTHQNPKSVPIKTQSLQSGGLYPCPLSGCLRRLRQRTSADSSVSLPASVRRHPAWPVILRPGLHPHTCHCTVRGKKLERIC